MHLLVSEVAAILAFVVKAFLHILPFLAVSIPLAIVIKRTGAAERIRTSLSGNPVLAVLLATVVGAVSPFCSCGVVPVISALLISGVPLAPVMSFWLASPSMDPEIFVLSVGSIGLKLAVWRLAGTFLMSLGGGLAVLWLERRGWVGADSLAPALQGKIAPRNASRWRPATAAAPQAVARSRLRPAGCGCGAATVTPAAEQVVAGMVGAGRPAPGAAAAGAARTRREGLHELARESGSTALRLSLAMLIAFLLEAAIDRYVPREAVASAFGGTNPWSVLLAALIGVPMYTTNLSALGIASGLLAKGASGGAILAFLVGGAVTTLPAMAAVYKLVRPRVFALYLAFSAAGSLASGYAFELAGLFR